MTIIKNTVAGAWLGALIAFLIPFSIVQIDNCNHQAYLNDSIASANKLQKSNSIDDSWKVFASSYEKGFFIRYPPDWNLRDKSLVGIDFSVQHIESQKTFCGVTIGIQNFGRKSFTLQEYNNLSNSGAKKHLDNWHLLESKDTLVYSYPGHQWVYTFFDKDSHAELKQKQLYFLHNNKAYIITYNTTPDSYNQFLPVANKIIYSFRFVN